MALMKPSFFFNIYRFIWQHYYNPPFRDDYKYIKSPYSVVHFIYPNTIMQKEGAVALSN